MNKHAAYFTYILQCSDGNYYTGKTIDLKKRLMEHNGILSHGAKYTRSRRPVRLVYFEEFNEENLALKRELCIKKLTHNQKGKLIATFHTYP